MIYLKNKFIEFIPLFDIDYNKKKNIIAISLFKIKTSYKSFDIYLDNIKNIYNRINKDFKNYKFRLFINQEIYNDSIIFNKLKSFKNIELILYRLLIDINEGLIGTLIRLFPMFDFENNDSNIVLINDLDHFMIPNIKKYFKILEENIIDINDIYLIKKGNILQNVQYNNFSYIDKNNNLNIYSYAPFIINIKKINKDFLLNNIENIINDKNNNLKYTFFTSLHI